jgi:hypothetical protein
MPVSEALRQRVRALDGDRCAYCRSPAMLSVATYEMDHIVPESAGGADSVENLAWCCPSCNRFKAARQGALDPETQQVVPLYHPRRDKWATHFAWSDDGSVVLGLTATGRATVSLLRINRPEMAHLRRLWGKLGHRLEN